MRQTSSNPASTQLFLNKSIVAKFNHLTVKNLRKDKLVINDRDTFPTSITSIIKPA